MQAFTPGWACAMVAIGSAMMCPRVGAAAQDRAVRHVIHISVDGLRPDAITALGASNLPHFYRLRTEGAFTDHARTDYDYTVTLPNHTSQLTGRTVRGEAGHGWTANGEPPPDATLASHKGSYVAGVFDVAHDHGLRTGHYASKSKFVLFDASWNEVHGAPDAVPPDHGRDKIDVYVNESDTAALVRKLMRDLAAQPRGYTFLHLRDPDSVGHSAGWDPTPGTPYSDCVKRMDALLGAILQTLEGSAGANGQTAIILTSDHGGTEKSHGSAEAAENFTIPFYVWGPGVPAGGDLYQLNPATRKNPGRDRGSPADGLPPIRNGEAGNLALQLLGLPPIPGSTLGAGQDLRLAER